MADDFDVTDNDAANGKIRGLFIRDWVYEAEEPAWRAVEDDVSAGLRERAAEDIDPNEPDGIFEYGSPFELRRTHFEMRAGPEPHVAYVGPEVPDAWESRELNEGHRAYYDAARDQMNDYLGTYLDTYERAFDIYDHTLLEYREAHGWVLEHEEGMDREAIGKLLSNGTAATHEYARRAETRLEQARATVEMLDG